MTRLAQLLYEFFKSASPQDDSWLAEARGEALRRGVPLRIVVKEALNEIEALYGPWADGKRKDPVASPPPR